MVEPSVEAMRGRLYAFYEQNNPANVRHVEQIVEEFAGREAALWAQLAQKYGDSAVRSAVRCCSACVMKRRCTDAGRQAFRRAGSRRAAVRTPKCWRSCADW